MNFWKSKFGKIWSKVAHDSGNATCTIGASISLIKSHLEKETIDKDYILERVERIKERNKRIDEVIDLGYKTFKELHGNPDGAMSIQLERERHTTVEGWTPEHDDKYNESQLIDAANAYISNNIIFWPHDWDGKWFKPTTKIRNLEKAGALIAAEIDRLKRLENGKEVV